MSDVLISKSKSTHSSTSRGDSVKKSLKIRKSSESPEFRIKKREYKVDNLSSSDVSSVHENYDCEKWT